jgi:hypothetical protein
LVTATLTISGTDHSLYLNGTYTRTVSGGNNGGSGDERLVGKWYDSDGDEALDFQSNGKLILRGDSYFTYNYRVSGNTINFFDDDGNEQPPVTYAISGSGSTATLTISGPNNWGIDGTYTRTVGSGVPGAMLWAAAQDTAMLGFSSRINGVTYGGGKWVAFGVGIVYSNYVSRIAYSTDGVSWTAVADTTFNGSWGNAINGVAYGGGKWIAVGNTKNSAFGEIRSNMAYSDDGITWTVADSTFNGYSSNISGVTYDGGKWVAVGYDYDSDTYSNYGKIAYSSDGVTWTAVADSTFNGRIDTVVYGGGKWVAVGYDYDSDTDSLYGKIAYSSDGVTWTAVANTIFGTSNISGVAYGGGKWVAVGYGYDWDTASFYNKIAYSSDGITWTAVANTTFGTSDIYGVAYGGASGNEKFVAVGSNKMAHSADGVSWTAVANTTFGTSDIYGVAYGGGKWLAFGGTGKMAYSVDE